MTFEPAAAAFAAAVLAVDAARLVAAGAGFAPMSCCSELNRLPNILCEVPTGICAAVLPLGQIAPKLIQLFAGVRS